MHKPTPFESADELAFVIDAGMDSSDGEEHPSRLRDEILSAPPITGPIHGTVISMRSLDGQLTISLGDGVDSQAVKARLAAGHPVTLVVRTKDAPTEVDKPLI